MSIDELRDQLHEPASVAERRLRRYRRRGGVSSFSHLGTCIAMAAGAYVAAVVAIVEGVALLAFLAMVVAGQPVEWSAVPLAIGWGFVAMLYGGLLGVVYAGVVSLPTLAIVKLSLYFMRWRPPEDHLGVVCGGLVAYLATLPLSLLVFYEGRYDPTPALWAWLIGPALAVLFGMIGGGIGGAENRLRRRLYAPNERRHPALRFSIAQLMGVTAIVSLLLTLLRTAGLLTMPMLLATVAWVAVQLVCHRPAMGIARCWTNRQQRRWRRESADRRERVRRRLQVDSARSRST